MFSQAKTTCEDYIPELPDTSASYYYNTHLTPTPPSSTLDDLSITIGMLLWSRNQQWERWEVHRRTKVQKSDFDNYLMLWFVSAKPLNLITAKLRNAQELSPRCILSNEHKGAMCVYLDWEHLKHFTWGGIQSVSHPCLCFWHTDLQTAAPDHNGVTENTAIIAGVVAALVLLVALTLLAVYYINTHPTVAPPFDLMQVNDKNTSYIPQRQQLSCLITHVWLILGLLLTIVCCS